VVVPCSIVSFPPPRDKSSLIRNVGSYNLSWAWINTLCSMEKSYPPEIKFQTSKIVLLFSKNVGPGFYSFRRNSSKNSESLEPENLHDCAVKKTV